MLVSKYKSLHPGSTRQLMLSRKGEDVKNKNKSIALGVSSAILFTSIYVYIYLSSNYNKGKFNFELRTFSTSCEKSEKTVPTILMVATVLVLQFFLMSQNICQLNSLEDSSVEILALLYCLLGGWLLLFFVFPNRVNFHNFITLLIVIFVIAIPNITYKLYSKDYEPKGLEGLQVISYMLIVIGILLLVTSSPYIRKFGRFFEILEICLLLLFSIFLIVCSTLPPLISRENIACFLK